MNEPPPPYGEFEKYPTTNPAYTATFVNPAFQGAQTPHLPGADIYGTSPVSAGRSVPINSRIQAQSGPVYTHRSGVVVTRTFSPEELTRRRRVVLIVSFVVFFLPIIVFLIVMTLAVWSGND